MRKHNRKIYYSAGLISIILLPLLCILNLKNNDAFIQYGSIDLYTWDGKEDSILTKGISEYLNSKKYTTVTLTGKTNSDEIKLNIAQKNIRKLILSKDSINGIRFHFNKKSEYWAFVKVLDILQVEKAKFYVPYKDDIWFANPRNPKRNKNHKKIKLFVCGTNQNIIYIDESESKIKWQEITEIVKKYYLPIIAYLLMIFFTFKRIMNEKKGIR
ncbi:TPA: hypothetical protein ACT5CJ_002412 [Flavobacterium psychrophilum]